MSDMPGGYAIMFPAGAHDRDPPRRARLTRRNRRVAGPEPRAAARGAPVPRPGHDRAVRAELPVGSARQGDRGARRRPPEASGTDAVGIQGSREEDLSLRRPQLLVLRARGSPGDRARPGPGARGRDRVPPGGGGPLGRFEATLDSPPSEGLYRVRLSPRKPDPEVEVLLVDLDPSGQLRGIQVEDAQGNKSRFRFEDVRENTGLPDKLFRFEGPPGVEVTRG